MAVESDQPVSISIDAEKIKQQEESRIRKTDEYDVDFSDTRNFAIARWNDTCMAIMQGLSHTDQAVTTKCRDHDSLIHEINSKCNDPASSPTTKRQMAKITQLPRVFENLAVIFSQLVFPLQVKFELIWGLVYINLRMSYFSMGSLRRATELLSKMRRTVELFSRCLDGCEEPNESRIAIVDFLDPVATILTDLKEHLHRCLLDKEGEISWLSFNENVNGQFSSLDQLVKHVNDITSYSKVNVDLKIKNLTLRHAPVPETSEYANFPNSLLDLRNPTFYGRNDELDLIKKYLSPSENNDSFRTHTIYGLRGVGKTALALEFAHRNIKPWGEYDAIYWIQCETSVSIRQSFTNVACSLSLPGADQNGHHEENLIAVHNWLARTRKKWLLIFDNAENETTLEGYWPVGVTGAILLTSRKYHNFMKDISRTGETVKKFTPEQSWELLVEFLGRDWKQKVEDPTEVASAKAMLQQLDGLALAIEQLAALIKDPKVGGATITETYNKFQERIRELPERHSNPRSPSERALDALWDIIFTALAPNTRVLIGVLAWLSSDKIPIDLFLPQDQSALDGPLSFCKQDAIHIDQNNQASLLSLMTTSPDFDIAIKELLRRSLITQDGRYFKIHRVVQEAINFHTNDALQQSFDTASKLVFQQFPDRAANETLFRRWNRCQEYISHAISLRRHYFNHSRSGTLKGSKHFIELMSNSGWYLYELGDYAQTSHVVGTGLHACENKDSLIYAELQLIDGCHHYELNQLADCRKAWDESLRVREKLLDPKSIRIAAIYNNFGNLELASGNPEEAKSYYERSMEIWLDPLEGGNTAEQLAVTYLCMGRFHLLQKEYEDAMRFTGLSETLFVRTTGADMGFMANVYYAYGNIHLNQAQWALAQRSYDACLKLALPLMPIHPLTASAWYSLGLTHHLKGTQGPARFCLEKARTIAQLRSPSTTDGATARILWTLANILEADPDLRTTSGEEIQYLRKRADMAKHALLAAGQGREILPSEEEGNIGSQEEAQYDILVPLFFR